MFSGQDHRSKSTGTLTWLDDTFKRNSFREGTTAASEASQASLTFSSSMFWNFCWTISSQWDLMRSCYFCRWDKQVISSWAWFIASWTSTQSHTRSCCTQAHSALKITRSHLQEVCDTHFEHLKDSELTQHERDHKTHSLHDCIVSVARARLHASLQQWIVKLTVFLMCWFDMKGKKGSEDRNLGGEE